MSNTKIAGTTQSHVDAIASRTTTQNERLDQQVCELEGMLSRAGLLLPDKEPSGVESLDVPGAFGRVDQVMFEKDGLIVRLQTAVELASTIA